MITQYLYLYKYEKGLLVYKTRNHKDSPLFMGFCFVNEMLPFKLKIIRILIS